MIRSSLSPAEVRRRIRIAGRLDLTRAEQAALVSPEMTAGSWSEWLSDQGLAGGEVRAVTPAEAALGAAWWLKHRADDLERYAEQEEAAGTASPVYAIVAAAAAPEYRALARKLRLRADDLELEARGATS